MLHRGRTRFGCCIVKLSGITFVITSLAVLLGALPLAAARTVPVKGAVVKPGTFKIRAPFPCGVPIRLNCGYGPSCSRAHKRTRAHYGTNDHYALDMARVAPLNGLDLPVVAVAPGIVRYSGWTKRGFAPYGQVVFIEHFFKDREGKRYQTLYAHLRRVHVKKGQRVKAGTVIGTLGGSSRRKLLKFGAHLHFVMYRGARRTMGGGQAVIPEPMGHQEDLHSRMRWIACERTVPPVAHNEPGRHSASARGGLLLDSTGDSQGLATHHRSAGSHASKCNKTVE